MSVMSWTTGDEVGLDAIEQAPRNLTGIELALMLQGFTLLPNRPIRLSLRT